LVESGAITPECVLDSHCDATFRRIQDGGEQVLLVAQDTITIVSKCQINNYRILLASGRILAVWRHAQGTVVGDLAGFGGEAGDLPLHLAGGRPALGVWRAGMRGVPDAFADV
jgi:hypothetical protein